LRRRFTQWELASPQLEAICGESPRLWDLSIRARQLGELGAAGLEALARLDAHTPSSAGWIDTRRATLSDAEEPSALVRFVFLADLRRLVEAAAIPLQP
jgi:hexosaminidase